MMSQCDSHADIHVYLVLSSWRSHAIAMRLHEIVMGYRLKERSLPGYLNKSKKKEADHDL